MWGLVELENQPDMPNVFLDAAIEWVFETLRPGPMKFKEFMQAARTSDLPSMGIAAARTRLGTYVVDVQNDMTGDIVETYIVLNYSDTILGDYN